MSLEKVSSINWKLVLLISCLLLLAVPPANAQETPAELVIGGASPTEGLVISTTATDFTRTFQIINTTGNKITVTVELPELVGPDSKTVKTSWQLNASPGTVSADIEGQQSARLQVKADLPGAGLYESSISLIYNSKRFLIPLKITRTASVPSINITGLDPVTFDGFGSERVIRFSLRDTGGVPVALHSPGLLSLTRKLGDKTFAAEYGSVEFFKVKNDGGFEPIVDAVQTGAHQSVPLAMKLKGVSAPGEYVGSLSVSSNDGALPVQSFSFFLKRPWWVCALLISLGVIISHWLRNYTKNARPRLVLARRVALLRQDFDRLEEQLSHQQDKDLLDALRRRLDRAADEIDISDPSTIEPIVNDLNAKLSLVPIWSNLRQRIDAVQPPSAADAARNDLRDVKDFLEANNNNTQAEIDAQKQKLRAALTSIDDIIRQRLVAEVDSVVKMAKEARGDLSQVRQTEFDNKVIAPLTAATAEIQKSPPNATEARRLINDARVAYAKILSNELEEKIAGVSKPATMTDPEWTTLKASFETTVKKVREATDGVAAVKAYEDVYAGYLRVLIEVARKMLDEIQPRVDSQGTQPQKDELAQARKDLNTADARLRNGELTEAQTSYKAVKAVLDKVPTWFPASTPMRGAIANILRTSLTSIPVVRLIPGLDLTEFADTGERRNRDWSQLEALKQKLKTRDRILTLIVLAAAVALGLYNIWVDNPAWGTAKDGFVAVLWGLGLHQLAGNVLFGRLDLTQLTKDLTGKEGG